VRAFLGVAVRPPACDSLKALRERLAAEVPAVRWTPAASPHITLHFFGVIGAADAQRALAALRPVVTAQPPISLRLQGLGSFPDAGPERVLWYGVQGDTRELILFAAGCRNALAAARCAVDTRPFRPHCTLGRPRSAWPAGARDRWLRHVAETPGTPAFTVDSVLLYESVSDGGGVRHEVREVLPFSRASASWPSPDQRGDAARR
jgi:2'-5' RNA ligase